MGEYRVHVDLVLYPPAGDLSDAAEELLLALERIAGHHGPSVAFQRDGSAMGVTVSLPAESAPEAASMATGEVRTAAEVIGRPYSRLHVKVEPVEEKDV